LACKNELLNENGVAQNAILNITVVEAKDLTPMDYIGRSDPYVIINLDKQNEKTNFISDTLDPVWNEEFVMYDISSF
jgi:Ca2+-dependent lipid-binding protein